jgi:hypothetical protein
LIWLAKKSNRTITAKVLVLFVYGVKNYGFEASEFKSNVALSPSLHKNLRKREIFLHAKYFFSALF